MSRKQLFLNGYFHQLCTLYTFFFQGTVFTGVQALVFLADRKVFTGEQTLYESGEKGGTLGTCQVYSFKRQEERKYQG